MSTAAATISVLAGIVAVATFQAFWITRYVDARLSALDQRLDRIEVRLDRLLERVGDLAERVAALEERERRA